MDKKYNSYHWENGPRLLLIPYQGVETVYLEMTVNCGSFMEPKDKLEISHLLEHMQVNFTSKKYPNAKKIRNELEKYGCKINAITYNVQTTYYITTLKSFLPKVLDIFLESFVDFKIDLSEFETEKNSIVTEITQNDIDDIWSSFYTTIDKKLFGSLVSSAFAKPQEKVESVKLLKPIDIFEFRKQYYENPRLWTLTISGDFSLEIFHIIEQKWVKKIIKKHAEEFIVPNFPLVFKEQLQFVENQNVTNTKISIIWGLGDKITPSDLRLNVAINLLSMILTDGLSSRLYTILRIEKKIVYSVNCFFDPNYYGSSLFYITTEFAKKNLKILLDFVMKEMEKLSREKISFQEFEKVKNKSMMKFCQEKQDKSPQKFAQFYSYPFSFDQEICSYKAKKNAYLATTADDILFACQFIINCNKIIVYSGKN